MRVGIIGVGTHASTNLLPNLSAAGLDPVAVCARHRDRAELAARKWRVPEAFDSAAVMVNSVELDGVIVCVSPSDYEPLISLCLDAGTPVFCDKPGASSAAEAAELASLSKTTGVPVIVGYMKRFALAYRRAREIISSPEFGPPTLGVFTFVMGQGWNTDLRSYLLENAVHHLDLARYLVGELTDLQAHVTELTGYGHAIAVIARASSGAVCTLNLCTTASWHQRNEYAEVYGKGHAVYVDNVDTCTYRPREQPEQTWRPNYTVSTPPNLSSTTMGFVPELEHFRAVAMGNAQSLSDMASAARSLALAEQLCDLVVDS